MTNHMQKIHLICLLILRIKLTQHLASIWAYLTDLPNETCVIVCLQTGMQSNHFASTIDYTVNIPNFPENHTGKSFFSSPRFKGDLFLNFSEFGKVISQILQT